MDLSFTKDSNWVAQREMQWKAVEAPMREGLSRKKVEAIKHYFMTGEKSKTITDIMTIISFFPAFTIEGIQYCLKKIRTHSGQ